MMAILGTAAVILLLVALSVYVGWLMMPLCPGPRDGFEEYDLLLTGREHGEEMSGGEEFGACCDAQGLRIAGAESMLRGDEPGRTEVFMGELPCALRPHALDGQG